MDVAVTHPFLHYVWPRSHGVLCDIGIAFSSTERLGHDEDGLVKRIDQYRPRIVRDDIDGMRIYLFDFLDFLRDELVTVDGRLCEFKSKQNVICREGCAVLPFHPLAQMESPCVGVQKLSRGGKSRDYLARRIAIHQPVIDIVRYALLWLHGNRQGMKGGGRGSLGYHQAIFSPYRPHHQGQ